MVSDEVSNLGRVRRIGTGRILKPKKHPWGYAFVVLSNAPIKQHARTIHSIVAEVFIGRRPKGLAINHKNGIKTDNRELNLEYVTYKENMAHAKNVLKMTIGRPSRFTHRQIKEMRRLRATGMELLAIASKFDCSFQYVSDIARGKRGMAA